MNSLLPYLVSLGVMVISLFITLYFKTELERMFRERKEVIAFHICNVLIILMVSFAAHAVTTIYIVGGNLQLFLHVFALVLMILPSYLAGHLAYEKYKFLNRKYDIKENGKVLVINERYLRRK